MRNCKRFLALALALLTVITLIPTAAAADSDAIQIMVNGRPIFSDTAPFIDSNGRTMVPARFISESLNAGVDWDAPNRTVTITRGSINIILQIGSRELSKNGSVTMMDTEAIISDERTFVPVRFIAEALGATVDWDAPSRTVRLSGGDFHPFSPIFGYDGTVYSIYASPEMPNFIGLEGSEQFTPLPKAISEYLKSEGEDLYVYSFAIYQDKIYYLAAGAGSDVTYGSIYRCNLDGSGNDKLVSVVKSSTYCMIANDALYYDAETAMGEHYVNAIDIVSLRQQEYSDLPVYVELEVVTYDGFFYYFSDSTLYKKQINTERESLVTSLTADPMNASGCYVIAVVYGTVYYATLGEKDSRGRAYLFGVSIYGGTSEPLASWFRA